MCEDARMEAYTRMIAQAVDLGADGVVAVRYQTGEVRDGVTEVLCFGTAVSSEAAGSGAGAGRPGPETGSVSPCKVTTSSSLPGLNINKSLGIAQGLTVRSSNVLANIGAGFKTMVGGEIKTWTNMCQATRQEAFDRMLEHAQRMGGKGVVAMRFDTNQVNDGMVEVLAYGTVVSDMAPETDDMPPPNSTQQFMGANPNVISTDLALPEAMNIHASSEDLCSLGLVRGVSVQSVNLFRGIGAGFKAIVGGEIRNYTEMCEKARAAAYTMMQNEAAQKGADRIVGFRYQCNDLVPGTVEVIAYGTAIGTPASIAASVGEGPLPVLQCGMDLSLVTTTNMVVNQETTRSLGVVRGVTVRSRNIASNFGAGLKAGFVGGEITQWRDLCDQARAHAFERMLEEAAKAGARGIVAMRFETNELSPGITEVLCYGTAVA